MIWKKVTIETTNEAADIVASVLFDNGIVGAEIDDTLPLTDEELKKMYVDIPIKKENDGIARVNFFVTIIDKKVESADNNVLNDTVDNSYKYSTDNNFTKEEFNEIINNIKKGLNEYVGFTDMGTLKFSEEELDDKIFLNKWKENFKRIEFDDVHIIPSWEKLTEHDKDSLNIFVEPGSAFGTGQHATTKLCVKSIKKVYDDNYKDKKDVSLLDVGCGSGILAICALKLGINKEMAIDIDESVELNLKENVALNGLNDFKYLFGNLIDDKTFNEKIKKDKYDIVVANILAPVIISLINIANIDEFIKDDGYFICSGILKEKKHEVLSAIGGKKCLKVVYIYEENDWVCIICQKTY